MLACVLRRSRIDGVNHAAAVIKLIFARSLATDLATDPDHRARGPGLLPTGLIRWGERHGVAYTYNITHTALNPKAMISLTTDPHLQVASGQPAQYAVVTPSQTGNFMKRKKFFESSDQRSD